MGGGGNASPPVDVAPGGGTFPVNSAGEAYNPAWPSGGDNDWLSIVGSGLASLGKGFSSAGQTKPPSFDTPSLSGANIHAEQFTAPQIPQNNLVDALLRLLGGR